MVFLFGLLGSWCFVGLCLRGFGACCFPLFWSLVGLGVALSIFGDRGGFVSFVAVDCLVVGVLWAFAFLIYLLLPFKKKLSSFSNINYLPQLLHVIFFNSFYIK